MIHPNIQRLLDSGEYDLAEQLMIANGATPEQAALHMKKIAIERCIATTNIMIEAVTRTSEILANQYKCKFTRSRAKIRKGRQIANKSHRLKHIRNQKR